ncbi:hypothetical protein C8J57DRAFT_154703 [Mycena rebaudengoi]|nr:hypothetical protein C8J57DRAFT_154703 [Mycena rebaudengoi]
MAMKRLFGGSKDKQKDTLTPPPVPAQNSPLSTPIHQQFASTRSIDEERWEVVDPATGLAHPHTPPLPPGASPPTADPRAPSPFLATTTVSSVASTAKTQSPAAPQTLRKKGPAALTILHSLDPQIAAPHNTHVRTRSEERVPEVVVTQNGGTQQQREDRKEKKGFWGGGGRDKEKEREREREREREHQRAMEMEQREREFQLQQQQQQQQQQQRAERGRDQREDNELTRKIGFLTATASEDWTLVLDVCEHASSSDSNAKEAVRALRREFKYGEPAAQLAAARLWAIMLRNSSDTFISQSTSRKFLDTLEDLLTSARTSPVVRERVMDVLAAAAYASGTKKDTGFRGLWRRVKPRDKPEEGMPFDTDDAMFNPPLGPAAPARPYEYHTDGLITNNSTNNLATPPPPTLQYHTATPTSATTPDIGVVGSGGGGKEKPRKRKTSENTGHREHRDREHRDRDRDRPRGTPRGIIPPDEDMRRLFQECKIGSGNAALLSQALAMATPEDLVSVVIKEFYTKCRQSQELIFAQIPWASAGAERSRVAKDLEEKEKELQRMGKNGGMPNGNTTPPAELLSTREEDLLADLLAANAELIEALQLYDDLERVAIERETEERSRDEVRMDVRQRQQMTEDGTLRPDGGSGGGGSSSRSRSSSPSRHMHHPLPSHPQVIGGDMTFQQPPAVHTPPHTQHASQPSQTLAPPPAAPHGPRSPGGGAGVGLSRTPSPATPHHDAGIAGGAGGAGSAGTAELANGMAGMRMHPREYAGRGSLEDERYRAGDDELDGDERPVQPSAKALGKRPAVADPYDSMQPLDAEDASLGLKDNYDDRPGDSDDEIETPERLWQHIHHPVQRYVYDAAAERTQQRIAEGHQLMVNGVH